MLGEVVGGYRISAKLGEGGMGVVYLAEHTIMGRKAVVKVLRPQLSGDSVMVQRFFNEARAAGSISHPGIVGVFDLGTRDDGSAFIIMDYLEGESLAQRLSRVGRLPSSEALAITRQILSALCAAHDKGIIHRDLKPDNIFLTKDAELASGERVKLLDFGIAKLHEDLGGSMVKTRAGAVMGTPIYMSPEQCLGTGECDKRADIYSVGVMLFELLTGRPPFVANTVGELMAAHLRDAPPRLHERLGETPEELEQIVARFLAKSPDDRYASGEIAIAQIDAASMPSQHVTVPGRAGNAGVAPWTALPAEPVGATAVDASAHAAMAGGAKTQGTTSRDSVSSLSTVAEAAPRHRRTLVVSAIVLLIAACAVSILFVVNAQRSSMLVVSSSDAAELLPVPGRDASSEVDARPAKDATPRADRLPVIELSAVSDLQIRSAKRSHKAALVLHRSEDYPAAFKSYEAAVLADPGHIMARYDYACALNLAGEVNEAIAILQQLRAAGCAVCLGRLIRARGDTEWKSAWENPEFIEVTERIPLEQPSPQESARALKVALTTKELDGIAALIHPRSVVTITVAEEGCKNRECRSTMSLLGVEALRDWLVVQEQVQVGDPSCRRNCCLYSEQPESALELVEMCTVVDSGSVRTLSKMVFTRR